MLLKRGKPWVFPTIQTKAADSSPTSVNLYHTTPYNNPFRHQSSKDTSLNKMGKVYVALDKKLQSETEIYVLTLLSIKWTDFRRVW
jgi:hypothetical protein